MTNVSKAEQMFQPEIAAAPLKGGTGHQSGSPGVRDSIPSVSNLSPVLPNEGRCVFIESAMIPVGNCTLFLLYSHHLSSRKAYSHKCFILAFLRDNSKRGRQPQAKHQGCGGNTMGVHLPTSACQTPLCLKPPQLLLLASVERSPLGGSRV